MYHETSLTDKKRSQFRRQLSANLLCQLISRPSAKRRDAGSSMSRRLPIQHGRVTAPSCSRVGVRASRKKLRVSGKVPILRGAPACCYLLLYVMIVIKFPSEHTFNTTVDRTILPHKKPTNCRVEPDNLRGAGTVCYPPVVVFWEHKHMNHTLC